jgi:hypothetical protein
MENNFNPLIISSTVGAEDKKNNDIYLEFFSKMHCRVLMFCQTKEFSVKLKEPREDFRVEILNKNSLILDHIINKYSRKELVFDEIQQKMFLDYFKFELLYRASLIDVNSNYLIWMDYNFSQDLLKNKNFEVPKLKLRPKNKKSLEILHFSGGKSVSSFLVDESKNTEPDLDLSMFCLDRKNCAKIYFKLKERLIEDLKKEKLKTAEYNVCSFLNSEDFRHNFIIDVNPKADFLKARLLNKYFH